MAFCAPSGCIGQDVDLWEAIRRGQSQAIERYIAEGGDPNALLTNPSTEAASWPLLQVALYDREEDIAVLLLRAGADFDAVDMPLDLMIGEGLPRFIHELLLRHPELLRDASPAEQASFLYPAASKGYYQVVDTLLVHARRLGVEWDTRIVSEAVAYAVDAKHEDIARSLLSLGANLEGATMRVASRSGSPGVIRHLISLGGDPDAAVAAEDVDPAANLRKPIDFAWRRYNLSSGDQREIARMVLGELISAGATPSDFIVPDGVARNGMAELNAIEDDAKRLVEAARYGYLEVASSVLRNGRADSVALSEALSVAFRASHNDIARLLIEAGAPFTTGALHAAAAGNSPGLVRLMLERGADPNEPVNGMTPTEAWWQRTKTTPLRASSDYILHELVNGGANVCWLVEHYEELNPFAADFLKNTATECWATAER